MNRAPTDFEVARAVARDFVARDVARHWQFFQTFTSQKDGHGMPCPYGRNRLTAAPTAKVVRLPISTYHVYAIGVKLQMQRTVVRPANIPISAPVAVALRSSVPRRKRPKRLPKGRDATVKPASRSGPHFTKPKAIRMRPQTSVMRRERRRNFTGSVEWPRSLEKSRTLLAARELREPLALDMATATMLARSRPARPVGISRTRKSGRMRSVRSPAARSGECCAKT